MSHDHDALGMPFPRPVRAQVQDHQNERPRQTGRRPLSVSTRGTQSTLYDAAGNDLFITTPGLAHIIAAAVNSHPELCAKTSAYELAFRDLRLKLRSMARTSDVVALLVIVDVALCDSDEYDELRRAVL